MRIIPSLVFLGDPAKGRVGEVEKRGSGCFPNHLSESCHQVQLVLLKSGDLFKRLRLHTTGTIPNFISDWYKIKFIRLQNIVLPPKTC